MSVPDNLHDTMMQRAASGPLLGGANAKIGPQPEPSTSRKLLEMLVGYPASPMRDMNPLDGLQLLSTALGAPGAVNAVKTGGQALLKRFGPEAAETVSRVMPAAAPTGLGGRWATGALKPQAGGVLNDVLEGAATKSGSGQAMTGGERSLLEDFSPLAKRSVPDSISATGINPPSGSAQDMLNPTAKSIQDRMFNEVKGMERSGQLKPYQDNGMRMNDSTPSRPGQEWQSNAPHPMPTKKAGSADHIGFQEDPFDEVNGGFDLYNLNQPGHASHGSTMTADELLKQFGIQVPAKPKQPFGYDPRD